MVVNLRGTSHHLATSLSKQYCGCRKATSNDEGVGMSHARNHSYEKERGRDARDKVNRVVYLVIVKAISRSTLGLSTVVAIIVAVVVVPNKKNRRETTIPCLSCFIKFSSKRVNVGERNALPDVPGRVVRAHWCVRACSRMYVRACVRAVRVRVLREIAVDQQNAACSMFFPHIFSIRRRRFPSPNAGRIRWSSRVCVICDAAVTSCNRATSMTTAAAAVATTTISLHVIRNVHLCCLLDSLRRSMQLAGNSRESPPNRRFVKTLGRRHQKTFLVL